MSEGWHNKVGVVGYLTGRTYGKAHYLGDDGRPLCTRLEHVNKAFTCLWRAFEGGQRCWYCTMILNSSELPGRARPMTDKRPATPRGQGPEKP